MKFYFVYSQSPHGNSEMYMDHLGPGDYANTDQHIGLTNGIHALCGRHTRSKPFDFKEGVPVCIQCQNKKAEGRRKNLRDGVN